MKKFEFLGKATADICFKAYGADLNKLFENSALALFEIMINTEGVKHEVKREFNVKGNDLKSLMFNFLNELIFYIDAENLAFSKFKVQIDEKKNHLHATLFGEKINPAHHEIRTVLKACTYHKMVIKKNKIWEAEIIIDV